MKKNELLDLLNKENIEAKSAKFKDPAKARDDGGIIYFPDRVIIIKNEAGRTFFNEAMKILYYGNELAQPRIIPQGVSYPYYILEISETGAGCVWITREHHQFLEDLERVVTVDMASDDFNNFQSSYTFIINEEGKKFYGMKTREGKL